MGFGAFSRRLKSTTDQCLYSNHFIACCVVASVVVRVLWIILFEVKPVSDFSWYFDHGIILSQGKGYTTDGIGTARWPIGYPGFLGLLFCLFKSTVLTVQISNIILYSGIILLAYGCSKRIFHSEYAARTTMLFLVLYPNHIAYTSLVATEIFFTFLIMAGSYLLFNTKYSGLYLLLPGIVFGFATLTKPQALFIPVILLFFLYSGKKQLIKKFLLIFMAELIVITPLLSRNYNMFGKILICNNMGTNLLVGNSRYSNGKHCSEPMKQYGLYGGEFNKTENELKLQSKAMNIAVGYIIENPLEVIKLWPKKIWYLWYKDVDGIAWNIEGIPDKYGNGKTFLEKFKILAQSYYIFFLFMFFSSLMLFSRRKLSKPYHAGIFLMLYFTAISMVFFGSARFHFPLIPLLALNIGIFLAILHRKSSIKENMKFV